MTITVADVAQSCFTSLMAATKTRRESKYEKAERLVAEGRYAMDPQSSPPEFWVGTCRGGRQGSLCSHAIGAEELRTRGEK
jgi:hypothetical protein